MPKNSIFVGVCRSPDMILWSSFSTAIAIYCNNQLAMEHLGLEAGEASVHQNGVEISRRRRLAQRGLLYSYAVCVARARAKSDEKRQCPGGWIAFQCSGWCYFKYG